MDLNKKLEELKPYQLNCNVFDVYSYNGLSMQELLCQFFTKINECINVSNETFKLSEWLVNEGLNKEVAKKLELWLADGTLEDIINVELFSDINGTLKRITNYIDPDTYKGTDGEKLQKAIDEAIQGEIEKQIVLNRVYDITGTTLFINRDKLPQQQYYNNHVRIVGNNGGLVKYDRGYWFSSNDLPTYEGDTQTHYTGDLRLENLWLKGSDQNNVILIDGDKLIRTYIYDCDINYVGCLIKSTTYSQSLYALRNKIRNGKGILLDTENNYDLNFSDNLVEWIENFFKFSGANGCRITNNLVEGIKGYTVLGNGVCQSLSLDNNYFEFNKSYIDLTNLKGYGLTIKNSYAYDTDDSKTFIKLPTKNFGDSPHQDQYTFISNVVSGGLKQYEFTEEPQSEVKIISIGCMGVIKNYIDRIQIFGTTYSETRGDVKIYYKNGTKCLTKRQGMEFNSEEVTKMIVDMGEDINDHDIINVKLVESSGDTDLIQLVNVYPRSTTVEVSFKGSGKYTGTMHCVASVTVLKTPFTQWF